LEEAKFLDAVKAKAFQQKDGAKFVMNDGAICDFNFNQQYTQGWDWTWQVPRSEFDKVLADECEKMGVPISYETEVTDIKIYNDHSITTVKKAVGTTETIRAKFIVDGSGYGRVIPRLFGLERPSSLPPRKTIFCHMSDPKRAENYEPDRIIVYVYNKTTWVWIIPFSNGNTSLGFVGDPDFFDQFNGDITQQYQQMIASVPYLQERFGDAVLQWEQPRQLQSWSVTTDKFYGDGFVLTGNVTEFLDPVFSSGVTLAAVSAQLAAKLVIKHLKGETVDWDSEYMKVMQSGVEVFRTYVNGWYNGDLYKIFFAKDPDPKIKAQICSVLAGYVWDQSNPFVKSHEKNVRTLAHFLETHNTAH